MKWRIPSEAEIIKSIRSMPSFVPFLFDEETEEEYDKKLDEWINGKDFTHKI